MSGYALAVRVRTGNVADKLWRALSTAKAPASVRDLHKATAAHPASINPRLLLWERAGFLTATSDQPRRFIMASSAPPAMPPSIRKDGVVNRRITGRQRIWSAIRVMPYFDLQEAVRTSEQGMAAVKSYINLLRRAGYVTVISEGRSTLSEWPRYRLARNTGRIAPSISHRPSPSGLVRVLIDHNGRGAKHDISPGRVSLRPVRKDASVPDESGGES